MNGLERAVLAVAVGAAGGAYLAAHTRTAASSGLAAAAMAALVAWLLAHVGLRPKRVPPLPAIVRLLLVVVGLLVFARPLLAGSDHTVVQVVSVAGGLLLGCAVIALMTPGTYTVPSGLLPATAGVLVAASIETGARDGFLPLAATSGAALWAWACLASGPRRWGPLAGFALAGATLAAATLTFLPWAQPHVERFVAQAYAEGQTGLSDRAALGDVGRLAVSRRVVARVWTKHPQLLRMHVFTHFDGVTWSRGAARERVVLPAGDGTAKTPAEALLASVPGDTFPLGDAGRGATLETKVVPSLFWDQGWGLLVPARARLLKLTAERMVVDDAAGRITTPGTVRIYGVANEEAGPGETEPSTEPPAGDPTRARLPDPRIRRLAEDLATGAASPQAALERTTAYLARDYRYSLEDLPRSLGEFLFEKKAGYCEYFASAAAVVLREQGIPTRFVKGVRVSPESKIAGHYVVRESHAHAWIDAYLPGEGWVEVDPTPPRDSEVGVRDAGMLAESWEALQAWLVETSARLRERGWWNGLDRRVLVRALVILMAVAAAVTFRAFLVRALRQAKRRSPRPPEGANVPRELRELLRDVERNWKRRGCPRPAARGLREHLDQLPPEALPPDARETSGRVVALYYRARFGADPVGDHEWADLRTRVSALR